MSDEREHELLESVRAQYHAPPETPREEMWARIAAGIAGEGDVIDLAEARRGRSEGGRWAGWAVAAAAVLVLGIGIGRMTAPAGPTTESAEVADPASALRYAAAEHLGRSGSLLRMLRADARSGQLDPAAGAWARGLLSETRLLIDAGPGGDPALDSLLEDLELVLVQIVGLSEATQRDAGRARTELDLTLRGLEDREVLSRIEAAVPLTMSGA